MVQHGVIEQEPQLDLRRPPRRDGQLHVGVAPRERVPGNERVPEPQLLGPHDVGHEGLRGGPVKTVQAELGGKFAMALEPTTACHRPGGGAPVRGASPARWRQGWDSPARYSANCS